MTDYWPFERLPLEIEFACWIGWDLTFCVSDKSHATEERMMNFVSAVGWDGLFVGWSFHRSGDILLIDLQTRDGMVRQWITNLLDAEMAFDAEPVFYWQEVEDLYPVDRDKSWQLQEYKDDHPEYVVFRDYDGTPIRVHQKDIKKMGGAHVGRGRRGPL